MFFPVDLTALYSGAGVSAGSFVLDFYLTRQVIKNRFLFSKAAWPWRSSLGRCLRRAVDTHSFLPSVFSPSVTSRLYAVTRVGEYV